MNADSSGLGEHPALAEFLGVTGAKPRPSNGSDSSATLPIAPAQHPEYGMTTEQLSEAQRRFTTYARLRLMGTGHRDYSHGDRQAFEDMGLHRLIDELRDEIADSVNYLTFLDIQLSRWKTKLEEQA